MQAIKKIEVDVLPDNAKRELFDFYEYLVSKYGKSPKEVSPIERKNKFLKSISRHSFKLPADYKFNREEIHENLLEPICK